MRLTCYKLTDMLNYKAKTNERLRWSYVYATSVDLDTNSVMQQEPESDHTPQCNKLTPTDESLMCFLVSNICIVPLHKHISKAGLVDTCVITNQ